MTENAFLTGSRAYGTPKKVSDIDLVIMTDEETAMKIAPLADTETFDAYEGMGHISVQFGKLNLIMCWTQEAYNVWVNTTATLLAKKPVTREEAVDLFNKMRKEAGLVV